MWSQHVVPAPLGIVPGEIPGGGQNFDAAIPLSRDLGMPGRGGRFEAQHRRDRQILRQDGEREKEKRAVDWDAHSSGRLRKCLAGADPAPTVPADCAQGQDLWPG